MIKKEKKQAPVDTGTISTLLGRDTEIEGTFSFKDTIRLDGRVNGKIQSAKGTVIIGENAVIEADVQVGVAIIRGRVTGRVDAVQRIEIYAPAKVKGDISAPTITIDTGVVFNGQCQMHKAAQKPAAPEPKPVAKEPPEAAPKP